MLSVKCFCGISFNPQRRSTHLTTCDQYLSHTEDERQQFIFAQIVDMDSEQIRAFLQREYLQNERPISELQTMLNVGRKALEKGMKAFGFELRGMKQLTTQNRLEKIKSTTMARYGVENASQSGDIKKKKADTFIKNYGVDNIWKSETYTAQRMDVMMQRYGVASLPNRYGRKTEWWRQFSKEDRHAMAQPMLAGYKTMLENLNEDDRTALIVKRLTSKGTCIRSSGLEDLLANALQASGIEFTRQYFIGGRPYDFIFPGRIVLEVQGDFWHGSPHLFSDADAPHPVINKTIREIWQADAEKRQYAESRGFTVLEVWEHEIHANLSAVMQNIMRATSPFTGLDQDLLGQHGT